MSDINKEENIFEKVKSVIVDYVKEKETDYAILLNGDWGCGKTYFVEKILNNELKEYKLVHISVAGIKDITEFTIKEIEPIKEKFDNLISSIKGMITTNMDVRNIAEYTGISVEYVNKIKEDIKK